MPSFMFESAHTSNGNPMKYKAFSVSIALSVTLVISLSLSGCWTLVKKDHPLIQKNLSAPYAPVYFIRARTERYMGMADNRVSVLLNQQPLLELVKGEYTLVNLTPGFTVISVHNQTTYGPDHKIKVKKFARAYDFKAGNTYYILVDPVDGEFRGVHFIPRSIDVTEAAKVSNHLRAAGLASKHKISVTAAQ